MSCARTSVLVQVTPEAAGRLTELDERRKPGPSGPGGGAPPRIRGGHLVLRGDVAEPDDPKLATDSGLSA